jgi:hypothetical protein
MVALRNIGATLVGPTVGAVVSIIAAGARSSGRALLAGRSGGARRGRTCLLDCTLGSAGSSFIGTPGPIDFVFLGTTRGTNRTFDTLPLGTPRCSKPNWLVFLLSSGMRIGGHDETGRWLVVS